MITDHIWSSNLTHSAVGHTSTIGHIISYIISISMFYLQISWPRCININVRMNLVYRPKDIVIILKSKARRSDISLTVLHKNYILLQHVSTCPSLCSLDGMLHMSPPISNNTAISQFSPLRFNCRFQLLGRYKLWTVIYRMRQKSNSVRLLLLIHVFVECSTSTELSLVFDVDHFSLISFVQCRQQ